MPKRNCTLETVAHQQLVELFDALVLMRAVGVADGPDAEADRVALLAMAMDKVSGVIGAITPHV